MRALKPTSNRGSHARIFRWAQTRLVRDVEEPDDKSNSIPIARCRELLGDEAEALTDQEVALIRRHAETMACVVVEMYLEHARIPE